MTAKRAVRLAEPAVQIGAVEIANVTVVVPESVNGTGRPRLEYPALVVPTSSVRPAEVVGLAPMFGVDRNRAIFQLSESMSNVPSRGFVRPPFVKVHAPAAIWFSLCDFGDG